MRLIRHSRPGRWALAVVAASAALATGCGATVGEPTRTPPQPGANTALHATLPDSVKESGVIRFAGDSHPPYRTVGGGGGEITGIDADIQDELSRVLGVRIETSVVDSLPAALQGMLAGRYDAFNGPVKVTAERERQFDTVTWMTTRTSYVVPADPPTPIAATEDLCGRRVAVVSASVVEEQLRRLSGYCERTGRGAVESVGLADTNATLLAAQSGRAEAAGMTQAAAIDVTSQQQGAYTYVTQTEEQGATADKLALYVAKSSELGPAMQGAFEELFRDGSYRRIMQKWGLDDVTVPAPEYNAGTAP
ncbi:ABC transporter substrate-binding protein [Pseudonocardia sp. EC080610-09]|uniref:transporter substrate-binding domain-containing protein n=1 Tax=unclassified Pseudonocardia TaxID=2619320 RepID=UPI0006CB4E57|nr:MULTISPECIES: transporter substrate-binding domain-containing protein [unclassified Pseudonocardia]ALE73367.1 ABC transporter substrate-binding protein [Pseudonocardia sp. EC080625-04]ALL76708.1 ABC transporter substrate-binding protein [Pseudonocardia sp. EC080610-09]